MTEKQFVYYEHKGADYILDNPNTELDFIEMLGDALETEEIVDKLNELHEENQRLKEALLFFVDVANAECSSNWQEDMEKDCQKLFNCSYNEAQEKYDNYDSRWWELE